MVDNKLIINHTCRATSGTRTHDLFVTNEMLYQLSYCGNEVFVRQS